MRFWLRELGGWLLILMGFYFFYLSFELAMSGKILYVWPIAIIGIFVFRGGIQLLKIAVAARICEQVQERLYPAPPPVPPPLGRRPGT